MATHNPLALLQRLLREPSEKEWLEFKQNNASPDEIGRCVSACANSAMLVEKDRAFIVFGIDDKAKKKVGTDVRFSDLKKGGENFCNWLSRMLDPHLMLEFLDFDENERLFAILTIEPTYDRPVRFAGTEYIRIGENVKPLKEFPEHEKALWLATGRRRFESAVALPHQSAESVLESLDADCYYSLSGEPRPRKTEEVLRRFQDRELIRENMEGGYEITNLGAILFAKDITKFPSIASKSVRVIRYAGRDKRKSGGSETEGRKGYALGFAGLLKFVKDALPKEEKYPNGIRREVLTYSETAIREIIANALIHQDFTISGAGPVVEIYEDRVEVVNPGNSLIEVDRIIDDRRSRNEKIAAMMRALGICEERGGGIDKAIIEIEEMFLPAPEFFTSKNSMRVVIFGPKQFGELSKPDKRWACFCHCVVKWIRHDFMTNASLRERFGLRQEEYQAVSAVIADARKARRILPADPEQGKRYAQYVPYWAG